MGKSVVLYRCQGDRDVGRPSYGLPVVCAKATKKIKKLSKTPWQITQVVI